MFKLNYWTTTTVLWNNTWLYSWQHQPDPERMLQRVYKAHDTLYKRYESF